ncbi:hypothetical protein AOXY_G38081 [Acipenser oxyrinchus oxyrinchus]|uniref:Uncharacterized protein n=1 Tax=Acipenser oxyrinchus oxyrinchus TaxID=40147 RepID=A0AAD8FMT4_ACIOX|nr:hypothetical protein AOXY_G38081 [Acipenser oxyrinchus oxyrinchus]
MTIYSSEDHAFVLSDGSLKIVRFSAHLSGIYYCVFGYAEGKLITLYKVNLMDHGIIERGRLREKREYEQYVELVSEEHFASAIAASVIVTFLGAFILGAISSSFFNECCRKIKHRRNATKSQTRSENPEAHGESSHNEEKPVDLNQRDQNSGMNKDNQEGPSSSEESGDLSQHQPKAAKRRVIKLYNYDEEGKLYDHIKSSEEFESESEQRMKRRSLSLTRLNAIMSVAFADDFNSELNKNQKQ